MGEDHEALEHRVRDAAQRLRDTQEVAHVLRRGEAQGHTETHTGDDANAHRGQGGVHAPRREGF